MSFRRQTDKGRGGHSRRLPVFAGRHGGYTATGRPDEFAVVCDFDGRDNKLVSRQGKQKLNTTGHAGTVQWIGGLRFAKGQRFFMWQAGSVLMAEQI
jgi:hypothetical protein